MKILLKIYMKILGKKKSAPSAPRQNYAPQNFWGGCNHITYAGYKGVFFTRPKRPIKNNQSFKYTYNAVSCTTVQFL